MNNVMRSHIGWCGWREVFDGVMWRVRREFTLFGPKSTIVIGPLVVWIYWEEFGVTGGDS